MQLSDARDSWLRALRAEGASPNTQEIYSSAVDRFLEYLQTHHRPTDVAKIEREDVQGFITHLQDTRSQATAHNRFRALRALFNYCADGGDERTLRREGLCIIDRSPMRRMPPPKLDDRPIPLLTAEQIEALWHLTERPGRDFRKRRDSAIIRLFLATGVRVGEMAGLHQDDLDLRGQIVTVGGKGHKWRRVPYSGAAAISLDRYLAVRGENRWVSQTERVWLGIKGHMTVSGIQDVVERMGARAGVADLHPHQLRHVFVDGCFADGMIEKDVESLLGWSSSAMSRRYASARRAQRAIETYRRLGIGDPYRRS